MTRLLPLVLALAACVPAPPPAAPPPPQTAPAPAPPPPPAPEPLPTELWTAREGRALRTDEGGVVLPYAFMRLELVREDSADLLVRCVHCPGMPTGRIGRDEVVFRPTTPVAARGGELAEFALAVRHAAALRDVDALRRVMSRDFVHTLGPVEMGPMEAVGDWETEQFRTLDRLPFLLDRGIATVPGTEVWAAPPEFASVAGYADLRAGFRRGPEGWEWIFFVQDGR